MLRNATIALAGVFFTAALCFAGSDTLTAPAETTTATLQAAPVVAAAQEALDITLWGRVTAGQVVSSATEQGYDYSFGNEWLENFEGGVRLNRQIFPSLLGRFNVGFAANASTVRQKNFLSAELTAKKFTATLLDASMLYTLNFTNNNVFQIEFGYFPFKYNPQSTNLGEYLFRSNCYPSLIVSGFENSYIDKPKIGGLHLGYLLNTFGVFKQDLLVNTELDIYPLHDINLTYIAAYTPHPIVTIGAGVQAARLIVMDRLKTAPGLDTNFHPVVDQWVGYVKPGTTDTTLYTFAGTKLMARGTLDLKACIELFTGRLNHFGTDDLKLYGEAALLGVRDYPGWYEHARQRTPVMAGLNLPNHVFWGVVPSIVGCFWPALNRFLDIISPDVFSVELEQFKNPYWNSQEFIWKSQSPVPYIGSSAGSDFASWADSLAKTDDDLKWSIYASKKIGKFLRISAQAASDHTPRNWYTPGPPSFVKYTDMVPRTRDWYYMMRVSYYF
jgi:hypothetical protein